MVATDHSSYPEHITAVSDLIFAVCILLRSLVMVAELTETIDIIVNGRFHLCERQLYIGSRHNKAVNVVLKRGAGDICAGAVLNVDLILAVGQLTEESDLRAFCRLQSQTADS